jgi:glycosyltransferase involved in cell wall biosynthesis
MRVVQLVTQDRGGPVDHAVDVACALAARGHDSHVVGPLGIIADRLAGCGVELHDVSMPAKTDIRGAVRLGRSIASLAPDVLHCQDRRAGLVGRVIGRRYGIGQVVYTLHGVPDGLSTRVAGCAQAGPPRPVRDRLYYLGGERLAARAAPGPIVVPCEALVDYVRRELRQPDGRVHVVPNGVDVARFKPAGGAGADQAATAVWLGLMKPVKRVDELVRVAAGVTGLHLTLIGNGPLQAQVADTIGELDLSGRVTMSGFQDDPSAALAAADIFVLPSAAEAFPLAVLQAMASGLPVVATRVAGVPELVRDGVDGLLVDADDWPAFGDALRRLAGDADQRKAMGRSARARVAERFSLDACVDGLIEVYRGAAA